MRGAASTALGAPPAPRVFLHRREFPFPLRLLVHPKNRMTACFPKARGAGRKSTASLYLAPPGVSRGSGRDVEHRPFILLAHLVEDVCLCENPRKPVKIWHFFWIGWKIISHSMPYSLRNPQSISGCKRVTK